MIDQPLERPRLPVRDAAVGIGGRDAGPFGIDRDHRVHRRVHRRDAAEGGVEEFDAGEMAAEEALAQSGRREREEVHEAS